MSKLPVVKFGFTAGEITPLLHGRPDQALYAFGLAQARNWFVDYRGGLSTRPGTKFIDYVKNDEYNVSLFPFIFSSATVTNYAMLFGHNYIRFIQDGSYVLESSKTITGATSAVDCVLTVVGHGYSNNDWIKVFDVAGMTELNQRTFTVQVLTPDTFQLHDPISGNVIDSTTYGVYTSGGITRRIYEVTTTYDEADLFALQINQSRSQVVITHPSYVPRTLDRVNDTNWTLADLAIGNTGTVPTNLSINPSSTASAGVAFAVTSVDVNGVESLSSEIKIKENIVDYSTTAGSCKFSWDRVTNALYYRIYRTHIIPVGTEMTRSQPLGLIGESFAKTFVDNNITPDFTQAPPVHDDPFADGAVEYIQVTSSGTGYAKTDTISISIGTGFVGYPIVNNSGALHAIIIINRGSGYTGSSVLSVTTSGGSGAAVTLTIGAASGNNPSTSAVFQQRRVYAATINNPLTIWGSQPGQHELFDIARFPIASDAYEYELDSERVSPIRHMISSRTGLVLLTQSDIWHVTSSGGAVSAVNALAEPQLNSGSSTVKPLVVGTDIIYIEGQGQAVKLLTWSAYQRLYLTQTLSLSASHMFDPLNPITSWAHAEDPYKLIYAVRADGKLPVHTIAKDQEVFAWTVYSTRGLYKDVLAIPENSTDTVYFIVERFLNGSWIKCIEQEVGRSFSHVEDAWAVDCGLSLTTTITATTLTPAAATGTGIPFTASAASFVVGDVGSYIRVGGGKALITAYISSTEVTCSIERDIVEVVPEDPTNKPLPAAAGTWTIDLPVTSISGLWHLNNETVKILADGNVLPDQVVTGGKITLPVAASRVIVGLSYTCTAKTLAPSSTDVLLEAKKKREIDIIIRLYESRGLKIGSSLTSLKVMKERQDEPYGQATLTRSGVSPITLNGKMEYEPATYYVQDEPLPATLLAVITNVEAG